VIASLADQITRSVDAVTDAISAPFSDPVIRLGVTGLSRAGKTVFITSLVANLMDRGRMPQLVAANSGAIQTAFLQPQPDDTLPRFDYETYHGALTASDPRWPDGTRQISELRLSLRVQPTGLLGGLSGPRTVHIDIVDYPGEWLLDLGLLDQSYDDWSRATLARAKGRPLGDAFLASVQQVDQAAKLDESVAKKLAADFTAHLNAAREAGFSDCTPGRFLLPGDLAGSPVLTRAIDGDHIRLVARCQGPRRFRRGDDIGHVDCIVAHHSRRNCGPPRRPLERGAGAVVGKRQTGRILSGFIA